MTAKYKSLDDLVSKIQYSHQELLAGNLDERKLDLFIEDVQELQERLVIMRFKAYEEAMSQTKSAKKDVEIDLRNQISLIDAIEEEVKKEPSDESTPITFVTPKPKSKKKKTTPKPEVVAKQVHIPEVKPEPQSVATPVEDGKEVDAIERSLNEKLSSAKETSLNERLKKTPIENLPKAIGINQKYLFINELFNQNADHYNQMVAELDGCENYKQALTKVRGELVQSYKWDEEDKNVQAFMDLVERRYLN